MYIVYTSQGRNPYKVVVTDEQVSEVNEARQRPDGPHYIPVDDSGGREHALRQWDTPYFVEVGPEVAALVYDTYEGWAPAVGHTLDTRIDIATLPEVYFESSFISLLAGQGIYVEGDEERMPESLVDPAHMPALLDAIIVFAEDEQEKIVNERLRLGAENLSAAVVKHREKSSQYFTSLVDLTRQVQAGEQPFTAILDLRDRNHLEESVLREQEIKADYAMDEQVHGRLHPEWN